MDEIIILLVLMSYIESPEPSWQASEQTFDTKILIKLIIPFTYIFSNFYIKILLHLPI